MTDQTEIEEVSRVAKEITEQQEKKTIENLKNDFDGVFDKCSSLLDKFVPKNDANINEHTNALASIRLIFATIKSIKFLNEKSQGTGKIILNRSRFISYEKLKVDVEGIIKSVDEESGMISKGTLSPSNPILDTEAPRVNWDEITQEKEKCTPLKT